MSEFLERRIEIGDRLPDHPEHRKFSDLGDETTLVNIEHRGWEKLGERGPDWRDTNRGGWDGTLPHYIAACK